MKRKILIVDDEEGLTQAIERIFRGEYEVRSANDGEGAIQMIRELQPELVLLDWRLKGEIEGQDVLLFSKREYPKILIYVLTASTHLEKDIRSLGADDCLFKPCPDLEARIHAVLPPSRIESENA